MRKAMVCARVSLRLYIRSGRIVFPLLALVGYPLIFYYVLPVDATSSFLMSTVQAFAWGAWIALAASWSEDAVLRQVFLVKAGRVRYHLAQMAWLTLLGAVGGVFLVCLPMLLHVLYLPDMFARAPMAREVALGVLLNACAGVCGACLGAALNPTIVRDRKAAYLSCLLIGLLSLVDGMAGIPFALRLLLPPIYDSVYDLGQSVALETNATLGYCLRYVCYAGVLAGISVWRCGVPDRRA